MAGALGSSCDRPGSESFGRWGFDSLGVLLVGSWDFNFLGSFMNYNQEAKALTSRRGSEVSQVHSLPKTYLHLLHGCRPASSCFRSNYLRFHRMHTYTWQRAIYIYIYMYVYVYTCKIGTYIHAYIHTDECMHACMNVLQWMQANGMSCRVSLWYVLLY